MRGVRRRLLIAAGVAVFVLISLFVGRWLHTDTVERDEVEALLEEQNRGDVAAMLERVRCPDAACRAQLRRNARLLSGPEAEIDIARYDSGTSHALTPQTDATRVVWLVPGRKAPGSAGETVVQCFEVERDGNVISGTSVTLLRVSAPIGRESSCE